MQVRRVLMFSYGTATNDDEDFDMSTTVITEKTKQRLSGLRFFFHLASRDNMALRRNRMVICLDMVRCPRGKLQDLSSYTIKSSLWKPRGGQTNQVRYPAIGFAASDGGHTSNTFLQST